MYPPFLAKYFVSLTNKLWVVVRDDRVWHLESAPNILPYELGKVDRFDLGVGFCFNPFREIISGDQDVVFLVCVKCNG